MRHIGKRLMAQLIAVAIALITIPILLLWKDPDRLTAQVTVAALAIGYILLRQSELTNERRKYDPSRRYRIPILAQDMNGEFDNVNDCPVARAIRRYFSVPPRKVEESVSHVYITTGNKSYKIPHDEYGWNRFNSNKMLVFNIRAVNDQIIDVITLYPAKIL